MADILDPIVKGAAFQSASLVFGVLFLLLTVLIAFWVYRNAQRRGASAVVWVVVTAFVAVLAGIFGLSLSKYGFGIVGLFALIAALLVVMVYMFIRPSEDLADDQEQQLSLHLLEAQLEAETCPVCGHAIEREFLLCPNCHTTLRVPCDYCGHPIKPTWTICPYCSANQGARSEFSESTDRSAKGFSTKSSYQNDPYAENPYKSGSSANDSYVQDPYAEDVSTDEPQSSTATSRQRTTRTSRRSY